MVILYRDKITEFAPPERLDKTEIFKQYNHICKAHLTVKILDSFPMMTVILNKYRQIVYANKTVLNFLGVRKEEVLGLRPGEAFGCIHTSSGPAGCGTSKFCKTCGAVKTILGGIKGDNVKEECRLVRETNDKEEALDLDVWSYPIEINNDQYTVFSIIDSSAKKRKDVLERIFFHDLLNLATALQGWALILGDENLTKEERLEAAKNLQGSSEELIQEILAQKTIAEAETGILKVNPQDAEAYSLLNQIGAWIKVRSTEQAKKVKVIQKNKSNIWFKSDTVLLKRVIFNLVKNALEAISPGETVEIWAEKMQNGNIVFYVKNPGIIPPEIKLQIFKRSFSTKGKGRGIGTWAVKMLTENYLKGKVSFESEEDKGTIFMVEIPEKI